MKRIRSGDRVIVIAGKDKGKTGKVTKVTADAKVFVEGINRVKKHVRPNPMRQIQGGIVEKEMPIHISNVALLNPKTGKADRVGFKFVDNKKVRYFKSTQELVDG